MSLGTEIRQTRPFRSPRQEAYLNLLRTADRLLGAFEPFFRKHGLSEARYNALRILRGAGEEGLPCLEVGERMVARAPDVTRLLDGLERGGLVARRRSTEDRRVVRVRATAAALRLLAAMEEELDAIHESLFPGFTAAELKTLNRLLEKARAPRPGGKE